MAPANDIKLGKAAGPLYGILIKSDFPMKQDAEI